MENGNTNKITKTLAKIESEWTTLRREPMSMERMASCHGLLAEVSEFITGTPEMNEHHRAHAMKIRASLVATVGTLTAPILAA